MPRMHLLTGGGVASRIGGEVEDTICRCVVGQGFGVVTHLADFHGRGSSRESGGTRGFSTGRFFVRGDHGRLVTVVSVDHVSFFNKFAWPLWYPTSLRLFIGLRTGTNINMGQLQPRCETGILKTCRRP